MDFGKVIFMTDLDGTLLTDDKRVRPRSGGDRALSGGRRAVHDGNRARVRNGATDRR